MGPDIWIDSEQQVWRYPQEGELGDPTDVLDAFMTDVQLRLWKNTAKHHNGGGFDHSGADVTDLRKHVE